MFKNYDLKVKRILSEKSKGVDWKSVLEYHRLMISRIQHERLIHLLVTVFVGVIMASAFFVTMVTEKSVILFLDVPLLILFVGYLFHYRFLENTTQNWYTLEDKIGEQF
jgi:hypothetical protein